MTPNAKETCVVRVSEDYSEGRVERAWREKKISNCAAIIDD